MCVTIHFVVVTASNVVVVLILFPVRRRDVNISTVHFLRLIPMSMSLQSGLRARTHSLAHRLARTHRSTGKAINDMLAREVSLHMHVRFSVLFVLILSGQGR